MPDKVWRYSSVTHLAHFGINWTAASGGPLGKQIRRWCLEWCGMNLIFRLTVPAFHLLCGTAISSALHSYYPECNNACLTWDTEPRGASFQLHLVVWGLQFPVALCSKQFPSHLNLLPQNNRSLSTGERIVKAFVREHRAQHSTGKRGVSSLWEKPWVQKWLTSFSQPLSWKGAERRH